MCVSLFRELNRPTILLNQENENGNSCDSKAPNEGNFEKKLNCVALVMLKIPILPITLWLT